MTPFETASEVGYELLALYLVDGHDRTTTTQAFSFFFVFPP